MKKLTDDDIALFRATVKNVTPLKADNKQRITRKRPKPVVRRGPAPETTASAYPFTDHLQETVGYDEKLFFKTEGIRSTTLRALRQGKLKYTAVLDLHGQVIATARSALSHFLQNCVEKEQRCVLIIHGKGRLQVNSAPKLKNQVNNWLKQHPAVLAFCSAQPRDGGAGAVYVLLRNKASIDIS